MAIFLDMEKSGGWVRSRAHSGRFQVFTANLSTPVHHYPLVLALKCTSYPLLAVDPVIIPRPPHKHWHANRKFFGITRLRGVVPARPDRRSHVLIRRDRWLTAHRAVRLSHSLRRCASEPAAPARLPACAGSPFC